MNSAADDAAGLAIATTMTSQIRGQLQGARNIADGRALAQTAQSALAEMTGNVQRIRELAVQAATGTLADKQRQALQLEVDARRDEAMTILLETRFNGKPLFGESTPLPPPLVGNYWGSSTISIQTGPNDSDRIDIDVNTGFLASYDVTSQGAASASISLADGDLEQITSVAASFGAFESRLESAGEIAVSAATNLGDARSRIMDADYASETTALAKQTILSNASSAMLAQANQNASTLLQLLR